MPELNSFLFGNILTVSTADLAAFAIFTAVLIAFFAWQYRNIVAVAFDRDFAAVSGLPVRLVSYTMTVLIAVGIVLTIRLVGIMLLMSMLSPPMITAEVFYSRFPPRDARIGSRVGGRIGRRPSSVNNHRRALLALIVLLMTALFLLAKTAKSITP